MAINVLTVAATLGVAAAVSWMFAIRHRHPVVERDVGKTFRVTKAKKRCAHLVCIDTKKDYVISYPLGFICEEGKEYRVVKGKDGRLHLEKVANGTK